MSRNKSGFTILEVLIALTAALLLMLGLTRAYKLLGDRITERQSQLELSSKLRDIAIRLRNELEQATCQMSPPAKESEGEGYLVYHEGPFTSSTTAIGSTQNPAPLDLGYFRDSRYGDIDDYLAFTARAPAGSPFIGFIPRGVLMAHRFANNQMPSAAAYTHRQATELVPFYSDVAEIAYWASPRYQRDPADGTLIYDSGTPSTTQPVIVDRNDDLLPDRLDLHRRVLLVRPDLNMTPSEMSTANAAYGTTNFALAPLTAEIPTLPFLTVDSNGDLILVPLSFSSGAYGNQDFFPSNSNTAPAPGTDRVVAPGFWWNVADTNNPTYASPSWLTGVARVQQVMDLSICRVTDTWSTQATGRSVAMTGANHYGMPSMVLAANSLGTLTRPENRFGFVRIPEPIISGLPGSSMPQLALCPPHSYLHSRFTSAPTPPASSSLADHVLGPPWPSTFPSQGDDTRLTLAPNDPDFLNPYGRFTMTTFLRPEFGLADRVTDRAALDRGGTPAPVATTNRGGSDVIATDVVGFDVRIYDPVAPKLVWEGPDRVPGTANAQVPLSYVAGDDDGDGINPVDPFQDLDEMGAAGSDDEPTAIDSMRIDEALLDNGTRLADGSFDYGANARSRFGVVDRGDFVDLNYARSAGGPMRGLYHTDIVSGAVLPFQNLFVFESPYSGVQLSTTPLAYVQFPDTWQNSGRFILRRGTGSPTISSFYQPVYDTWTDGYSTDVFDQEGLVAPGTISYTQEPLNAASTAVVGTYSERRVPQDNSANNPGTANMLTNTVGQLAAKRWTNMARTVVRTGEFAGESAGINQNTPTGINPYEIEPPIPQPLRALKITIRVDDFAAETIRQQTVIQEF